MMMTMMVIQWPSFLSDYFGVGSSIPAVLPTKYEFWHIEQTARRGVQHQQVYAKLEALLSSFGPTLLLGTLLNL